MWGAIIAKAMILKYLSPIGRLRRRDKVDNYERGCTLSRCREPVSKPPEALGLTCLPIAAFPARPRSVLPVLDNYGAVATGTGLPDPGNDFRF